MAEEFLAALDQIEYEKGVPRGEIMALIEDAVEKCLEKHYGFASRYRVVLDRKTGALEAWGIKKAVAKPVSPKDEVMISAAQALVPGVKLGADVELPIDINEIARIASQTIKKVITQKIREHEKSSIYKKFKKLEGSVITGRVFRFIGRKAIVDLGAAEGVLPAAEQIPKQFLRLNANVRVFVLQVSGDEKKCEIILSRVHPDFIKTLLFEEVPEVKDGIVEIIKIVRVPGIRSKVLVKSNNDKIDPVGTCVGVRGTRIKTIINDLGGERIDLINSARPQDALIAGALSPAHIDVSQVSLTPKKRIAKVTVTLSQRSQVIGFEGINVTLASQLTGWEIDIVTDKAAVKAAGEVKDEVSDKDGGEVKDESGGKDKGGAKSKAVAKSKGSARAPER